MEPKKYIDAAGIYQGEAVAPPADWQEVPEAPEHADMRLIDGQWKRPETKYYVDAGGNQIGGYYGWNPDPTWIEVDQPPEFGLDKWDHDQKKWIDSPQKYRVQRADAYARIPIADQIDAIYKFILANNLVVADPNQPPDTPAGWVSRITQIKQDYPKRTEGKTP